MSTKPIRTDDGNQSLIVIERELKDVLNDDPSKFPKLTAAHLMGTPVIGAEDTGVASYIDAIMPRDLRARAVGGAMYKNLLGNPVLLHELYLLGATTHGRGWILEMKATMRPDSLASGLTDAELGRAWEVFKFNVEKLAMLGRARRRKDWRG